jgi:hypothetical protein
MNQEVKQELLDVELKFQKTPKLFNQERFMEMLDPLHVEDFHNNEKKEEEFHIEPTIELGFTPDTTLNNRPSAYYILAYL